MGALISRLTDIQAHLDALARQHRVPGATLGVFAGDEFVEFATGVLNRDTGVEATPDSLFQIGSNTKLMTATLVMQLVDEGKVHLDEPVRTYIPEFRVASEKDSAAITVRHLLTHTSGIQGDHFDDHGRGDDCVEHYVASLAALRNVHRPGELFSYCNSGFVTLGRLIEKLTGQTYHDALRARLLRPLGMRATTVLAEEVIGKRVAIGHVVTARTGPEPIVAAQPVMARSSSPAGSLTWSTPRELLTFARAHVALGVGPNGTRVLSSDAARAMQQPQHKVPPGVGLADAVGLAWMLQDWSGHRLIRHGGGTIGQLSFLEVLPDDDFGVCLLTNAATGGLLWRDLARYLFAEFAEVEPPSVPQPPPDPPRLTLSHYAGRYERLGSSYDVEPSANGDGLTVKVTSTGALAPPNAPPTTIELVPIDTERFHARLPPVGAEALAVFLFPNGADRPRFLHLGGRASRRLTPSPAARKAKKAKKAKKASKARKAAQRASKKTAKKAR